MRVVNLGTVNPLSRRTPTIEGETGRHMSTAKRFINGVCIVRSGGIPYFMITIKDSSVYRGAKSWDVTSHFVYSSNRTFMEIHDRKSNSAKFGARLNSGSGKDSIQNIVDKANSNAVWSPHFIFSCFRCGAKDIVFDDGFDDAGHKFKGGRGR